jgi:hypothetical protein
MYFRNNSSSQRHSHACMCMGGSVLSCAAVCAVCVLCMRMRMLTP